MVEVWTAPFVATTNAIIASSDCNAGYRGNLLWIRQFLSADPASSNQLLQSSSTSAAAWVNRATVVQGAVGSLDLTLDNTIWLKGKESGGAARGIARMDASNNLILGDANNNAQIVSYTLALPSGTTLGGIAGAKMVASTYTGNNGASRQITTSFIPTYVVITWVNGSASGVAHLFSSTAGTTIISTYTGAATVNSVSQDTTLHASDGFVVDAVGVNGVTNTSGVTYRYAAFG